MIPIDTPSTPTATPTPLTTATVVTTGSRRTTGSTVALVAGLALQGVAAVFVAASGLLMPLWAVIAMWIVWAAGLAAQLRHRHRPIVVLGVPVLVGAVWLLTGTLGETFLGWTA
jgi:hypothetical protein